MLSSLHAPVLARPATARPVGAQMTPKAHHRRAVRVAAVLADAQVPK